MTEIDFHSILPVEQMQGDSEADTRLLKAMADEAERFLSSFDWCAGLREKYFGLGVGGVVAVFLFRIVSVNRGADEWLWVVTGDLPPAYLVVDNSPDPVSALETYISEMEQWLHAALANQAVDDLIPVNVVPTSDNAKALKKRLNFLKHEILPNFRRAPLS